MCANLEYIQFFTSIESQTSKNSIDGLPIQGSSEYQAPAFPHLGSVGGSSEEECRRRVWTIEERQQVKGEDMHRNDYAPKGQYGGGQMSEKYSRRDRHSVQFIFKKCSLEVTKLIKKHKPFFFAVSIPQESNLFELF